MTKSRRLAYSASIVPTDSCGPRSASTAPFCAIDVGLEGEWLCSFIMAPITRAGANPQPRRHPVVAYVYERDPDASTFSFAPSSDAIENGWLSYRKWQ